MRKLEVSSIVQIITTLSVILGVALVVYELRQTRDLTEAQLLAESLVHGMELKSSLVSEHGLEALGKACLDQELTVQEILALDTYFRAIYDQINYTKMLSRTFGSDWEEYAKGQFERTIFITQAGREWWESAISWIPADIQTLGESVLSGLAPPSCEADMRLRYSALAA